MSALDLRSDDPRVAERIFGALCAVEADRLLILSQLAKSIDVAEGFGPLSVSCSLFANGFRLNVGPVEALTFFDDLLSVFHLGVPPALAGEFGEVETNTLKSAPQPSYLVHLSVASFRQCREQLAMGHEAYLLSAATTQDGKPRKATFARYNCPGLRTFAMRQSLGRAQQGVSTERRWVSK